MHTTITASMPVDLASKVSKEAKLRGETASAFIRTLIMDYFESKQEYKPLEISSEDIKKLKTKEWAFEEVSKSYSIPLEKLQELKEKDIA